jgi:hypothetical protein
MLTPCPGFNYNYDSRISALLHYSAYSPRGLPQLPYTMERGYSVTCMGLAKRFMNGPTLLDLSIGLVLSDIALNTPDNVAYLNFPVGINSLSGAEKIKDANIVTHTPTRYAATVSAENATIISQDYDGDGTVDTTKRGKLAEVAGEEKFVEDAAGPIYGVFLSGSARSDGQPNFTRIILNR